MLVRVEPPAAPPQQRVDQSFQLPEGGLPAGWSTLAEGLVQPGDIVVTKQHWSAFHDTPLDEELRRRGVTTILLGGIATNFGVEATARRAFELGYEIVLVEDACTTMTEALHELAIRSILPRLARVVPSAGIGFAA